MKTKIKKHYITYNIESKLFQLTIICQWSVLNIMKCIRITLS